VRPWAHGPASYHALGDERVPLASTAGSSPGLSCPRYRNRFSLEQLERQRPLRKWSLQQTEVGNGTTARGGRWMC